MFHDSANQDFRTICCCVNVNLCCMAEVFVHQQRFVRCKVGLSQVSINLLLICQNFHSPTTQNVGRSNEHGETNLFNSSSHIITLPGGIRKVGRE